MNARPAVMPSNRIPDCPKNALAAMGADAAQPASGIRLWSVTFLCLWHEIGMTPQRAKPILKRLGIGGLGVFNGGARRAARTGQCVVTGSVPCISLALVRSAPRP